MACFFSLAAALFLGFGRVLNTKVRSRFCSMAGVLDPSAAYAGGWGGGGRVVVIAMGYLLKKAFAVWYFTLSAEYLPSIKTFQSPTIRYKAAVLNNATALYYQVYERYDGANKMQIEQH